MRILSMEEMSLVVGGGRLDSADYDGSRGGWGKDDNSSTHGPSSRGRGTAEHDRHRAQESYLGTDVYGANAVGLNPDVGWGAAIGALGGALGGVAGVTWGGLVGALGGARGGFSSPSPSNNSGREQGGGDSDGRGSR